MVARVPTNCSRVPISHPMLNIISFKSYHTNVSASIKTLYLQLSNYFSIVSLCSMENYNSPFERGIFQLGMLPPGENWLRSPTCKPNRFNFNCNIVFQQPHSPSDSHVSDTDWFSFTWILLEFTEEGTKCFAKINLSS